MAATTSTATPSSTFTRSDDLLSPGSGAQATQNAADAAHDAIATADRKADAVLDRFVQGAHHTIDRFAEKAAPMADKLQKTADSARETISAKADSLNELQQEWLESMRTTVRENPLTAVLAAAAIGVLVAKLTSRD